MYWRDNHAAMGMIGVMLLVAIVSAMSISVYLVAKEGTSTGENIGGAEFISFSGRELRDQAVVDAGHSGTQWNDLRAAIHGDDLKYQINGQAGNKSSPLPAGQFLSPAIVQGGLYISFCHDGVGDSGEVTINIVHRSGKVLETLKFQSIAECKEGIGSPDSKVLDTTPPGAPGSLVAVAGANEIGLTWTAASDDQGIGYYVIYRDTVSPVTTASTKLATASTTAYIDETANPSTTYYYRVLAVDTSGNVGPLSNEANALYTTPPTAPTNLQATPNIVNIELTWDAASDDTGVSSYSVYRDTTSPVDLTSPKIATTSNLFYTDNAVASGVTYYYAVHATDTGGSDGPFSNEDSAVLLLFDPGFAYEDVDGDMLYDPAVDKPINKAELEAGNINRPGGIVIPKSVGDLVIPGPLHFVSGQHQIYIADINITADDILFSAENMVIDGAKITAEGDKHTYKISEDLTMSGGSTIEYARDLTFDINQNLTATDTAWVDTSPLQDSQIFGNVAENLMLNNVTAGGEDFFRMDVHGDAVDIRNSTITSSDGDIEITAKTQGGKIFLDNVGTAAAKRVNIISNNGAGEIVIKDSIIEASEDINVQQKNVDPVKIIRSTLQSDMAVNIDAIKSTLFLETNNTVPVILDANHPLIITANTVEITGGTQAVEYYGGGIVSGGPGTVRGIHYTVNNGINSAGVEQIFVSDYEIELTADYYDNTNQDTTTMIANNDIEITVVNGAFLEEAVLSSTNGDILITGSGIQTTNGDALIDLEDAQLFATNGNIIADLTAAPVSEKVKVERGIFNDLNNKIMVKPNIAYVTGSPQSPYGVE